MFSYARSYNPERPASRAAEAEYVRRINEIYQTLAEGLDDRDAIEMDVYLGIGSDGTIWETQISFNELEGAEAVRELNRLGLGLERIHDRTYILN